MTNSELNAVMVGGFASIAGGVLAAYVGFGVPAEHLIAASVMSAPAALAVAKLMHPETEEAATAGELKMDFKSPSVNAVDAISTGILDGLHLCLNVGAMLIGFIALLACMNALMGWVGGYVGLPQLSLEWIFSYLFSPIAWLMGVPWADCGNVGILLGKKTAINEFIAYADLKPYIENNAILAAGGVPNGPTMSPRAVIIATYALCGFANFSSIGIQIGGIGAMAPDRRSDLARLGLRAMIGGSIATFMMACIAGMLL
jgi:CNT family concentrative nucleoside transporter